MAHRSEQGNVLGFVLVGALLVALLLGGIYVARNTMGQLAATSGTSVPNATDNASDKDTEPADGVANKDTGSSDKTDEQRLKETLEAQSAAEKKAREQQTANNSPAGNATKDRSSSDASSASHLPVTGPEEALLPIFGATLLAGTAFAYARSRRLI